MKKLMFAVAAVFALSAAPAMAEDAAPAAAAEAAHAHLNTTDTTIGDLLDNEAARAVLQEHVPDLVGNPQIEMARSMTLKSIQAYAPDLTDEKLAAIDADLAEIH